MRDRPHQILVYVFKLLTLALILQLTCLAKPPSSTEELREGAEKFVKLIEARDTGALLNLFSEQGTSFIGTAYIPIKASLSPEEIRKDFASKTGVYCLFLDTRCLQDEDSKERLRQSGRPLKVPLKSIVDLLTSATEKKFVTYEISAKNGKVSVLLSKRSPDTARIGEDAVNFYFRLEDGQWKLRNVEYN